MQKIKKKIYDKIMKMKIGITNAELSFLHEIAQYQDESGVVKGVHYKDISGRLGISERKFYDILYSLAKNKIISYEKNNQIDYDITIIDNDFTDRNYKKYMSMDNKIYNDENFKALKVNEKLLAIYFLRRYLENKNTSYIINVHNLFKRIIKDGIKVQKRTIRLYLESLRSIFHIGIVDGKYYITPRAAIIGRNEVLDIIKCNNFDLKAYLRRKRIKYSETIKIVEDDIEKDKIIDTKAFNDVFELLGQYARQNVVLENLKLAIDRSIYEIDNNNLLPSLVHKKLREIIIPVAVPEILEVPVPETSAGEKNSNTRKRMPAINRFNDFPQREYSNEEMSEIERKLIARDKSNFI